MVPRVAFQWATGGTNADVDERLHGSCLFDTVSVGTLPAQMGDDAGVVSRVFV